MAAMQLAFEMLGFILLGLSFGQASGVMANGFSKLHRYTGSELTSDLAWRLGANAPTSSPLDRARDNKLSISARRASLWPSLQARQNLRLYR
jgi:hypothetical protein